MEPRGCDYVSKILDIEASSPLLLGIMMEGGRRVVRVVWFIISCYLSRDCPETMVYGIGERERGDCARLLFLRTDSLLP